MEQFFISAIIAIAVVFLSLKFFKPKKKSGCSCADCNCHKKLKD